MAEEQPEKPLNFSEVVEKLALQLNCQEQELVRLRSLLTSKDGLFTSLALPALTRLKAIGRRTASSVVSRTSVISLLALVLLSTVAVASIPSSGGVINACYLSQ